MLTNGEDPAVAALVPLTIDGLTLAASLTALDAARRRGRPSVLSRWALGLGIAASITANVAHGLAHGLVGVVAGWPALALILVFELLTAILMEPGCSTGPGTAGYGVSESVPGSAAVSDQARPHSEVVASETPECSDPLLIRAVEVFERELNVGRRPSIRAALSIGQPKAQRVRAYLDVLAEQRARKVS